MSSYHPHMHHAIIGAGIVGMSLAYALSKAGCRVSVFEQGDRFGAQASGVPVALLNPHRGRSARAKPSDLAGLQRMRALATELTALGLEHGMVFDKVWRIASSPRQAKKWQKLAKDLSAENSSTIHSSTVRWHQEIAAPYHAPYGALEVCLGGWLEPAKLFKALEQAMQAHQVAFYFNHEIVSISKHEEQEHTLCLKAAQHEEADSYTADVVHFCIGAAHTLEPYTAHIPIERLAGDVIGLETVTLEKKLSQPIAGAIYGMQVGEQVYIGGNHRLENVLDPTAAQQLQHSASWFVPFLQDAKCTSVWTGVRAKHPTAQPYIQPLAANHSTKNHVTENQWYHGGFSGRGFLCAYQQAEAWVQRNIKLQ